MTLTLTFSQASDYSISYRGFKIGELNDFKANLSKLILHATPTSFLAKKLLKGRDFAFYGDKVPSGKNTKLKHDKKFMIYTLKKAIEDKPKFFKKKVDSKRSVILKCSDSKCSYTYYKNKKPSGKGIVLFDKNGELLKFTENNYNVSVQKM